MATRNSFISTIQNSKVLANSLFKAEPSMVPSNFVPKIQLVHVNVPHRITPGKSKKQSDIRQALISKLNNTEDVLESPLLSIEQVMHVKNELDSLQMNYDKLKHTTSGSLFNRINGIAMESEELFSTALCQQSEYIDWNRVLQQTYLLSHSSNTELLCHLLEKVESMKFDDNTGLSSQISANNITIHKIKPSKSKIKSSTENTLCKNKKKSDKEEKHGMDIRSCMALASEKARLVLDIQKEDNIVSQSIAPQSFTNVKTSPHIQSKKIIPKSIFEEFSNESNCILCEKRVHIKSNNPLKHLVDHSTLITFDQLSSVEMFVKSVSKEVICNINILSMFSNVNKYISRDVETNITSLKQNLEVSHEKERSISKKYADVNSMFEIEVLTPQNISTPKMRPYIKKQTNDSDGVFKKEVPNNKPSHSEPLGFEINDIFENELENLPKINSSGSSVISNFVLKKNVSSALQQKNLIDETPKKNYFNLDDIFNEESDDLNFPNLTNNKKTSTPIRNNIISRDICNDTVTSTTKDVKVPHLMSSNRSITEALNKYSSNKLLKEIVCDPTKNLFKIPPTKFDQVILRSKNNSNKLETENQNLSPLSPVLSGQISTEQFLNNPCNQSPESPILSGQLINQKPINVFTKPKSKCRALFNEDNISKIGDNCSDFSILCESLNSSKTENYINTENDKHILSASQLFDDESTSEENKNDSLEQSSMYTITQMVSKISALAEHTEPKKLSQSHIITGKNITSNAVDWGSFEEDYLFENINLDNLSNKTTTPSVIKEHQDNVSTTKKQSKEITNRLSSPVKTKVSLTSLVSNNQNFRVSKIPDCSTSWSSTHIDEENKKSVNKTIKMNEDSLITSRWLSCMKSPLHEPKINTTSTDSDSNSDVFQSPVSRKRIIVPVKAGKVAKKQNKGRLFLELEADVSGPPCSSDEENTSGLDDLEESFINDMTEHPSTTVNQTVLDIQAKYLQSIKSPLKRPGGYKIPTMPTETMNLNVFSQVVEDDDSYLNDSFCCDETEIQLDEDLSILEIAEQIINKNETKKTKQKKRYKQIISKSSSESEKKCVNKRLHSPESSCEDSKKYERKRLLSSSSGSCDETERVNKLPKRRKKIHLLTSDSDSTN